MQIAAVRLRRPLPTGEGGEYARLVVALGGGDLIQPGLHHDGLVGLHQLFLAELRIAPEDHAKHGARVLQRELAQPAAALGGCEPRIILLQVDLDTQEVRVIRHHQEIQRPRDLHPGVQCRMHDRQAAGEAVCLLRVHGQIARRVRVGRMRGVQMGVTPQQQRGWRAPRNGSPQRPGRNQRRHRSPRADSTNPEDASVHGGSPPRESRPVHRNSTIALLKVIHTPHPIGIHTAAHASTTSSGLPCGTAAAAAPCSSAAGGASTGVSGRWCLSGTGRTSQLQMKPTASRHGQDVHGGVVDAGARHAMLDLVVADVVHEHRAQDARRRPRGQQASMDRSHHLRAKQVRQIRRHRRESAAVHRHDHAHEGHEQPQCLRPGQPRNRGVQRDAQQEEHRVGRLAADAIRQRRPEDAPRDVEQRQQPGECRRHAWRSAPAAPGRAR